MAVSLRELLCLEAYQGVRVLAGMAGLDNTVRTVTVGEVPDQHRFVQGGELILSSFYAYRDTREALPELVRQHAHSGVAGIGFKPGLWIDELPPAVVATAETLAFPILAIPVDRRWPVLIESALDRIHAQSLMTGQQAAHIQTRLTQVMVAGGGPCAIADALAELIGLPVLVEDAGFRVLAAALGPAGPPDLRLVAETAMSAPAFVRWVEAAGLLARWPQDGAPLSPPAATGLSPRVVFPVARNGRLLGFLSIGTSVGNLLRVHQLAAEHAAAMVAVELAQVEVARMAELRSRGQALERFLQENRPVPAGADLGAGDDLVPSGVVMVIGPDPAGDEGGREAANRFTPAELATMKFEVFHVLHYRLGAAALPFIAAVGATLVVLVPSDPAGVNLQSVRVLGEELQARIGRLLGRSVSVGVGRPGQTPVTVRSSYDEARRALELNRLVQRRGRTTYVSDVGVYDLLLRYVDRGELLQFYTDMVRLLAEHDRKRATELLKTLTVFLDTGRSITDTAARLYLHRNGLSYRLRKIAELTGLDFKDSDQCLNWHIALKLPEILYHRQ